MPILNFLEEFYSYGQIVRKAIYVYKDIGTICRLGATFHWRGSWHPVVALLFIAYDALILILFDLDPKSRRKKDKYLK